MNAALLPKPSQNLHQRINDAIAKARNLSKQGKDKLAATAWDEVEELLVVHQKDFDRLNRDLRKSIENLDLNHVS